MSFSVAVVTSTRADWGLLKPFCDALSELGVTVDVVATGTHLSDEFGRTAWEIEEGGYIPVAYIPILSGGDDSVAEARTMATALESFAVFFSSNRPDAVLLLGDRFEILAIAEAAFLEHIPIVHLHGGEVTRGAIDDCIRHCISKLSSVHLVCADEYARRVRQLGEDKDLIYNIGAIGVENALNGSLLSKSELEVDLGLQQLDEYLLFTYHPVTLSDAEAAEEVQIVLGALKEAGIPVIATKANADAGGKRINQELEQFAKKNSFFHVYDSLGTKRYLSALRHSCAVVGNSSSGILEAPAFEVPTVNIGPRQDGRLRAPSVIDCSLNKSDIVDAIKVAMGDEFHRSIRGQLCPFGAGDVSRPAAKIIKHYLDTGFPSMKVFCDLDFEGEER